MKNCKVSLLCLIMPAVLLAGCGSPVPGEAAAASEGTVSESISSISVPGEEDAEPAADGDWEVWTEFTPSLTDEDAAIFSQAVEKLAGMVYQPACVMAVRNGKEKEYSFLCTEAVRTKPEEAAWRILLISQTEGKNAEVTGIMPVDLSNLHIEEETSSFPLLTVWEVPEAPASSLPEDADEAFRIAGEENGQEFSPVVLLGTKEAAGLNYCILCIGEDDNSPSDNALYAVTICKDIRGNVSFADIAKLDLADYTRMVCQPMNPQTP